MKYKYNYILGLVILSMFFIVGCTQSTDLPSAKKTTTTQTDICEELAQKLDEKIIDTNNPPGRFIINGFDGVVGGKLVKISEPFYYVPSDEENKKVTYNMTLKGINKEGDLFLRTSSGSTLPYEVGKFYKFDLKNRNQYSSQLSGVFMDPNLDALEHLPQCD